MCRDDAGIKVMRKKDLKKKRDASHKWGDVGDRYEKTKKSKKRRNVTKL